MLISLASLPLNRMTTFRPSTDIFNEVENFLKAKDRKEHFPPWRS